ncbi:MAG: DNA-binding response regulator [Terriglobia bacterium]|nr:MAG: DNA-binding response regulator [Terriglobia bacterium]
MDPANTKTIDLLIVDDHAMFREGLARSLEKDPTLKVVGQCASSAEALGVLRARHVSVVLLDMDLRKERGMSFVLEAKRMGFTGPILVVTAGVSGQEAVQLVQNGVAGILHKEHSTEALCRVIRQVAAGQPCLETEYLSSLFQAMDRTRSSQRPTLTSRDQTLLRFLLEGLTNKAIGQRLDVSEGAVKALIRQLFDKLGVRTRSQLVKVALEEYRDEL